MPNRIVLAPAGQKITHDPTKVIAGDPMSFVGPNPYGNMTDAILFSGVNTLLGWIDDATGLDLLGIVTPLEGLLGGTTGLLSGLVTWLRPGSTTTGGGVFGPLLGGTGGGLPNLTSLFSWLQPTNLLTGPGVFNPVLSSGLFLGGLIPGLDASKIVSGVFGAGPLQPVIDAVATGFGGGTGLGFTGLSSLLTSIPGAQQLLDTIVNAMGVTGTGHTIPQALSALQAIPGGNLLAVPAAIVLGLLSAGNIPSLDASKITTGTLLTALIPSLPASIISTGTFIATLIPGLDASKITSGLFSLLQIPNLPAGQITSGTFGTGLIPGLDASKITSGTFAQSMVNITSIAASLVTGALTAANIPGLDVGKIVSGVFGTGFIPSLPAAQITSGTFGSGLIPTLDASKIVSGILGIGQIPTSSLTPTTVPSLQTITDNIFNAFLGQSASGTALPDALMAMQNQYGQTIQNTKDIQSLQSATTATVNSGKTVSVDFSNYADGPLPSMFTVTYTGTGTSLLGITAGESQWRTLVNDNDKTALVRYNVAPTDTDFQIVRGTMTQAPNDGGISGNPRIWALARMNSAADGYVWARGRSIGFMLWQADIGCTIAGVDTVWVSNIPLTWSLNMYWKAGVGVNARVYELWSGGTLVYTHTEVGTASQLGSTFRYWGAKAEMRKGTTQAVTSGKIGGTSVSDNAPATVLGTHAHIHRTNTASVNLTGGSVWTVLPSSFFGVTLRASNDIPVDLTNGKFTAPRAGSYTIHCRIRLSSSVAALVYIGLWINGAIDQASDFAWPGDTSGESIGGHWTVYLAANDTVQIATWSSGLTVSVLTGEATGKQTFFNITGVGAMN